MISALSSRVRAAIEQRKTDLLARPSVVWVELMLRHCESDLETLAAYVLTVEIRDDAAERLRDCESWGAPTVPRDLEMYDRALVEAACLLPVIERMARSYSVEVSHVDQ